MSEEKRDKYDIELPQSIVESFARFIASEMKKEMVERGVSRTQKTEEQLVTD